MIALIQRVKRADVQVGERTTGEIGAGLLALVCAERGDTEAAADKLLAKLLGYRVFSDAAGKMNLPVSNIGRRGPRGRPAARVAVHAGGRHQQRAAAELHAGRAAR